MHVRLRLQALQVWAARKSSSLPPHLLPPHEGALERRKAFPESSASGVPSKSAGPPVPSRDQAFSRASRAELGDHTALMTTVCVQDFRFAVALQRHGAVLALGITSVFYMREGLRASALCAYKIQMLFQRGAKLDPCLKLRMPRQGVQVTWVLLRMYVLMFLHHWFFSSCVFRSPLRRHEVHVERVGCGRFQVESGWGCLSGQHNLGKKATRSTRARFSATSPCRLHVFIFGLSPSHAVRSAACESSSLAALKWRQSFSTLPAPSSNRFLLAKLAPNLFLCQISVVQPLFAQGSGGQASAAHPLFPNLVLSNLLLPTPLLHHPLSPEFSAVQTDGAQAFDGQAQSPRAR